MKKIVIIGGGVAGLSAGVYAQKYGFSSEIYEKHSIVGGQCTGWDRKGYHIDNCIHWMTGTKKNTELYDTWVDVGALGNVEVIQQKSYGTYIIDDIPVTIWTDLAKFEKELMDISPEDEAEIKQLIRDVKAATCMEMPAKVPNEMMSASDGIKMLLKMKGVLGVYRRGNAVTCQEYGKRYKSPILQQLWSRVMPEGYMWTSFLFSLATIVAGNGGIPVGVSRDMAFRMKERYESLGGVVHCSADVKEILIENGCAKGILLADGTKVDADYVIPAGDIYYTMHTLLKNQYTLPQYEERFQHFKDYPLPSSVLAAFGVKKDLSDYPDSEHWLVEPYPVGAGKMGAVAYKNYAFQKSFAPEGCTVITSTAVQFDEDYLWWKKLYDEDRTAYESEKKRIALHMQAEIEKRYPEFVGKMELLDVATPVTYERYAHAHHGAWMAFVMKPGQKNLSHNGVLKGLQNCYLAGQFLYQPGGLPTAVTTGKFAVQRICKKEKIKL